MFNVRLESMRTRIGILILIIITGFLGKSPALAQAPQLALWPDGIPGNPISYAGEKLRSEEVNEHSPSQMNRVFSQVSTPAYVLYQPEEQLNNGIALVICPGGGFRDVWFDREGVDLAMWLAERGFTSLVLKYRTYNPDAAGFSLEQKLYNPEVYADAKQAIHILRSRASDLGIKRNKIGIAGYSAGGALALMALLETHEQELPAYSAFEYTTLPDFACLIYPGIRNNFIKAVESKKHLPPVFIINGGEDQVTPASKCIELYSALWNNNHPAELHIYAKGRHGFDSGIGRGSGVGSWQDSFICWLKDMEIMD